MAATRLETKYLGSSETPELAVVESAGGLRAED
jgi:hypothetical protein